MTQIPIHQMPSAPADPPGTSAHRRPLVLRAFDDLRDGWKNYRELWIAMGWYDMRKRNRRSVLGPFWITISLGLFIAALSVLYGPLLGYDNPRYPPYIAFGFIAWQLISELISESCNVFISNAQRISQHKAPLSIYIYEMVWRNLLIFSTNIVIYLIVILLFGISPTWATLLIIPAVALICINGVTAGMLLGTLCTRFRDIPPIVSTVMRMMFLLTPIIWSAEQAPGRGLFALLNPLYYFVEIVRAPLLGETPSLFVWSVAVGLSVALALIALPFYGRFRNRIAYWV